MLAKYKKQLSEWFFFWSLYIAITGIEWIVDGHSPLVWPNVSGVIDWLGWSATAIAIWVIGSAQLSRDLRKRKRLEDAVLLVSFFARWLIGIVIFCALAVLRLRFFVWEAPVDVRSVANSLTREGVSFRQSVVVVCLMSATGLTNFGCRMIAVLVRKYARD